MFDLVQPYSDFHELTQTCQKSHNTGIKYFYEFKELEIISLSENKTEATIRGTIILKMPTNDLRYLGKFTSVCAFDRNSENWKLGEIRIEWE